MTVKLPRLGPRVGVTPASASCIHRCQLWARHSAKTMRPFCVPAADGIICHAAIGPRSRRGACHGGQQAAARAAPAHPPAHRDLGPDLACSTPRSIGDADADTATLALAWHLTCALSHPSSRSSEATCADATQGQRQGKARLRSRVRSLFRPILAATGLQAALSPSHAQAADSEIATSGTAAGISTASSTLAAALPSAAADAAPSPPVVDLSAAASAVADAAAALAGAIAQPSNFASRVARSEAVLEPVRPAETTACRDHVIILKALV